MNVLLPILDGMGKPETIATDKDEGLEAEKYKNKVCSFVNKKMI